MIRNRTSAWKFATKVATQTTTLSFAVDLVDPVTGGRPGDEVTVSLTDAPAEPVTNPSGYRLFIEVAEDPVTLVVDGGDRFFDEQTTVPHGSKESGGQSPEPETVTIVLTPTPAYQFAAGTTLLRGIVTEDPLPEGARVADATVSLAINPAEDEDETIEVPTTASGEYVLRVPISTDRVVSGDGDRWLSAPDGSQSPGNGNGPPGNGNGPPDDGNGNGGDDDEFQPPTHEVTVSHAEYDSDTAQIPIRAGATTRHDVILD